MFKRTILFSTLLLSVLLSASAWAGYFSWTATVEDDPFDNKGRLIMTYFDSADSGAVIVCDQESNAITLRIVTPIVIGDESVTDRPIWMGAIVDKNEAHLGFGRARVTRIGNLAFDLNLEDESAARFLHEMKNGQSKLYVKIHEDDPLSYTLDGSTRASKQAIPYCLTKDFSND